MSNLKKYPLIEMKGVTKEYSPRKRFFSKCQNKVLALNSIDFSIEKGEIFGLVGQSGSGKTTCGRLLVRLEEPTSGSICLNGEPINKLKGIGLKTYRSKVQMIFQDPYQSLNPHLSIAETILEPLVVNGLGNAATRREKVLHTLEIVGLSPADDFYDRYPHQLSGGQRQRVAIARAIVLDPDFIVADEPTSMLDATIAIQLFQLLTQIRKRFDMAFLFITHNLAAANYLCDRIAVIHEGHIVEVNTANNIIQHPEHPYTKRLIQVQPGFDFNG
ncbi:MAG: ATP-binding cassette domain-containing protein [Proteobacteria bacterium]|nr:ABC transporter ATP-binding protein [Desulfobacula sp.]MBU3952855.1 ATP-binding cassette domain-containing protein [Pseudomonadota bacterium]MBU4129954.1 ATP-binding cassette domain-containing protein [Pseudomonadota bacterium]